MELMQFNQMDASLKVRSLDIDYQYALGVLRNKIAIYNHTPEDGNQLTMAVGDVIVASNPSVLHRRIWYSTYYGTNQRTNVSDRPFPSYKTSDDFSFIEARNISHDV